MTGRDEALTRWCLAHRLIAAAEVVAHLVDDRLMGVRGIRLLHAAREVESVLDIHWEEAEIRVHLHGIQTVPVCVLVEGRLAGQLQLQPVAQHTTTR